ncbi:MAG: CCA tRNA nucleotidyltransferase [Phycisphaerales bacterium]|jgi:poly(A) polymerase|nr:CCA tRNA nucleotidyltransferase [Phycisphaerales bacterium]
MADKGTKSTALWVLKRLIEGGHEALLAGGCVRDMLLGRESSDYDIATSAEPKEVQKLFKRVLMIGAKFGVVMVIHDRRQVEVATFRSDLSYSDGRRPDGVCFTSARHDAERRDFTINGMFYDPIAEELIDYVGGREDIERKIIRTIGSPDRRFTEDYLRLMRAVRFTVRLGFAIDDQTRQAIEKYAPEISTISGERICDELSKMLSEANAPLALETLQEVALAPVILSELFESENRWPRSVERARSVADRCDLILTLAAVLCELTPDEISGIIKRWGASNDLKKALCWLAENMDKWRQAADIPLCDFKRLLAVKHFHRLVDLWRFEELSADGHHELCDRIAMRAEAIPPDKIAPAPLVTGADLIKLGLRESPQLGSIASSLYNSQLNEEFETRQQAMIEAEKLVADNL